MPMRVLAVADVFEAVTSERPYRAAMSAEQALRILRAEVPDRLDAEVVAALTALVGRRGEAAGDEVRAEVVLGRVGESR